MWMGDTVLQLWLFGCGCLLRLSVLDSTWKGLGRQGETGLELERDEAIQHRLVS
jgi:hypothetical protein